MKRRLIILLLTMGMVISMIPISALAATDGDYVYFDNGDSTCAITDYLGSATDIVIPGTLGGLTVTNIWSVAFYSNALTNVTIPDSVTTIGSSAFSGSKPI